MTQVGRVVGVLESGCGWQVNNSGVALRAGAREFRLENPVYGTAGTMNADLFPNPSRYWSPEVFKTQCWPELARGSYHERCDVLEDLAGSENPVRHLEFKPGNSVL